MDPLDSFRELGRRLLMLVYRGQYDADLEEEMRLHRELREQEEIERGLSAREAHYAVQRRFGNDLVLIVNLAASNGGSSRSHRRRAFVA